ncbi:MAG: ABC transporter permease subunit [Elusimicrobiota bacterium]|jgi:L-cystine transport system permease protein|nr:ABC transporter permease subunit [Elusimicrobiota bacterium]
MDIQVDFFYRCFVQGVKYIPITLILVFVPMSIALVAGYFIAIARVFKTPFLGKLLTIYVTFFRGIPNILILTIVNLLFLFKFDDFAEFFGLSARIRDVNTLYIALVGLTLYLLPRITETIRSALISVDWNQYEAGFSIGMTKSQIMRSVIIPQMIPVMIPVFTNNFIGLMKNSAVVFVVGVVDVLNASVIEGSDYYAYVEAYVAAAIIYWIIGLCFERVFIYLENYTGRYRKALVK